MTGAHTKTKEALIKSAFPSSKREVVCSAFPYIKIGFIPARQ